MPVRLSASMAHAVSGTTLSIELLSHRFQLVAAGLSTTWAIGGTPHFMPLGSEQLHTCFSGDFQDPAL